MDDLKDVIISWLLRKLLAEIVDELVNDGLTPELEARLVDQLNSLYPPQ